MADIATIVQSLWCRTHFQDGGCSTVQHGSHDLSPVVRMLPISSCLHNTMLFAVETAIFRGEADQ